MGNALQNIQEENSKVKAPLKNYTDIEINKPREYVRQQYKPKQTEEENRPTKNEISTPMFVNSNLESKSNFRELAPTGDVRANKV